MILPFSAEARRQFDPVVQQFGLVCVVSTEWGLVYENDKVFLKVNFDNGRSYELGVEIGRRHVKDLGPPFSLAEILRLRSVQDAAFVSGLMISDESRLSEMLSRLARLTLEHACDFLKGKEFSFAQVEKLRNKESAAFELATQLRRARAAIDIAWPARDYKVIVRVLAPLEQHLSVSEKKRLDYARKRLPFN